MPKPKTKQTQPAAEPPAAPAAQPNEYQLHMAASDARERAAKERAEIINNLLRDLDGNNLQLLETVRLMESRTYCGKDDPAAKFIIGLIQRYQWAEERGEGLTVEGVESALDELREDMAFTVSAAHFIASRYPQVTAPEASNAS